MKITKEEGVKVLTEAQKKLAKATDKAEILGILKDAGSKVGYAPAMRCLVAGQEPDKSIRWE